MSPAASWLPTDRTSNCGKSAEPQQELATKPFRVLASGDVSGWNEWWQLLQQPAYCHVLLNPLPVHGLAMGVVALVLALVLREKRAHTVALVLVAIACLSVWPVTESGQRAERHIARDGSWVQQHHERAERGLWLYALTALLAMAALVVQWTLPKHAAKLTVLVLLSSLASVLWGGWVAKAGGQIRHEEFRLRSAPVELRIGHEL